MPTDRSSRPLRRASWITLLGGVALITTYFTLTTLNVGKIGVPTDIGGAAILVVGYAATGIGLLMIVLDFLHHRSNRH